MEKCISTSLASPVTGIYLKCSRPRNQRHKLGKTSVVDCGKHVHCWSAQCPIDLGHNIGWRIHSVVIG